VERIEPLLTDPPRLADALFAAFVASLPADLAEEARGLAVTLGLAPTRAVPWSEVFSHEITLLAPRLVAEAMPGLPAEVMRDACLAHLLAIVEAFATDRVEDGQVRETPGLQALLHRVREARDAALGRVRTDERYGPAQSETMAAIEAERKTFGAGEPVSFARYLAVSHGKQRVGLPASIALAQAAGWDERRRRSLARLLDAVWLGLQIHDDVLDWQDDMARGGAWATLLAAFALVPGNAPLARAGRRDAPTVPVSVRGLVHASGILARMLEASARRFRAARRRAAALGAHRLAAWAREREAVTSDLAWREAESPGYTQRAHALSAWAKTVLP
jgi:hypothetical protein